ncbi:unnamed protein product [Pneumocystis jirovecii]|uniref:Uncharacterized protein n=1 Tax=Pneumocystis jirovecii TaxID=42068 RepID=L0PFG3_PNEJI|nr:unnamed protein product [Pneumocystis jirovecii]
METGCNGIGRVWDGNVYSKGAKMRRKQGAAGAEKQCRAPGAGKAVVPGVGAIVAMVMNTGLPGFHVLLSWQRLQGYGPLWLQGCLLTVAS